MLDAGMSWLGRADWYDGSLRRSALLSRPAFLAKGQVMSTHRSLLQMEGVGSRLSSATASRIQDEVVSPQQAV